MWMDIVSRADWVGEKEEVIKDGGCTPIQCVSVGWVLRCDNDMLVLADSYTKDKTYGGTTAIPQGVVIDVFVVDGAKAPTAYLKKAQLAGARRKKKK